MIIKDVDHEFRNFDIKLYLHNDEFGYTNDGRPSVVHMDVDCRGIDMLTIIDADEFHEFAKMINKIDREIKKQMQNYTEEVA